LALDVIVVGAGTAGATAARVAAEEGLKVCLIERKPGREVGVKVCGDAVGKHHFDQLGIEYPEGDELKTEIEAVDVYSPDLETVFHVPGEGFIIDRRLFGQRLLKYALDAGVNFMDLMRATAPIIEDGRVVGVVARDMRRERDVKIRGKIVIDASGFLATIRGKLPEEMGVETRIDPRDALVCYREIRELKEAHGEPHICKIYLNVDVACGGYYWIFPEGEKGVNVGLGIQMSRSIPNPKRQLYTHVLSKPLFEGSEVVHGGGWFVPSRRPLLTMVGDGFMAVGDAACQVNPLHGGGIGSSMLGGKLAGEAAAEAVSSEEVDREGLWRYNVRFIEAYGAKQAKLDVLRIMLQKLSNQDINYGMKRRLISEDELVKVSTSRDFYISPSKALGRLLKGVGNPRLLYRLYRAAVLAKKVSSVYAKYPRSPEEFKEWEKVVRGLFQEARAL